MAELARRTTICEMRRAGSSVSDIIKSTGYAISTVNRVVSDFDVEGKVPREGDTVPAVIEREPKHSLVG